ncbi:DUF1353 domain-containing protein (plasmid) [Pseudorhodobacter turbinis]|uniref:DUF1353 domain-containing protein n=1 Tax=Pseudorhodobacter turbinis TaxID=2500533 RepID=A0A4P8EKY3_9RHOB|nr:DUF1353 domain-containing protein [Pseudorhodobacter turbinis]QCO57435.1 DUF1353 domain-containing protein [Pseudorhodobacter turbinis]
MSQYTDLNSWYTPDGDYSYLTIKPITWEVGKLGSGLIIEIPVGYRFDVSVPWYGRWFVDPTDKRVLKAACLHDYTLEILKWDRVTAGGVFSEALRADKVSKFKRFIMVLAVSFFKFR